MKYLYGNAQGGAHVCPEIEIVISSPRDARKAVRLVAILDTGADLSAIPERARPALGDLSGGSRVIRDASSTETHRPTIFTDIVFDGTAMQKHEFAVLPIPYAIIGRDILNRYRILFDGLEFSWNRP